MNSNKNISDATMSPEVYSLYVYIFVSIPHEDNIKIANQTSWRIIFTWLKSKYKDLHYRIQNIGQYANKNSRLDKFLSAPPPQ